MDQINAKRVVLGGLVAGVISNVSGIASAHYLFAREVEALLRRLDVALGPGTAMLHVGMRLATGLGLVWLYAAIRPRFGPGPRTASLAGLVLWFFTFVFSFVGIAPYGLYPARVLVLASLWTFLEMQLCAQAGAWLYRE